MAILVLPLLWLNQSASHDWGGDFAMYIIQAKNLVQGMPQSDNSYIYNPEFARNGPANYPIGYPILLSPIYAIWGNNMGALSLFQSILAMAYGLTFFAFLKRHFTWLTSILIVLILIYNPWFLYFKRELMSDIPFAILVLLFLMALRSKQKPWLIGLLALMMILFRGIGWFVLPAVILPELIKSIQNVDQRPKLWRVLKTYIVVTIGVFVVNRVFFDLPMSTQSYSDQLVPANLFRNIEGNFLYFKDVLADHLFRYWENSPILSISAISFFSILILIGAWASIRKQPIYAWSILVYFIIILVYPYRYSGFRFIFPIYGIMLALAAMGLYRLIPSVLNRKWLIILVIGAYLSTHIEWWRNIVNQQHLVQPGPQHMNSEAMFSFLKNEPDQSNPILFIKPRVLGLYANRSSVSNEPHGSQDEIKELINNHGIKGFILCTDVPHPSLQQFIADNMATLFLKFENDQFQYYSLNTTQ
jgi:hypothetical protein